MPYPQQINLDQIRLTGLDLLETSGEETVTIRGVARRLNVSPNALYRYTPNKDALLAECAAEGAAIMLSALESAPVADNPQEELYIISNAYLFFTKNHPALYQLMMKPHTFSENQEKYFNDLWTFLKNRVQPLIPNADEAAVAIWAYLHGIVELEKSDVFQHGISKSGIYSGLRALLSGYTKNQDQE
jgi:AcrR family transcriptional regulator